jgi:plastocyanin
VIGPLGIGDYTFEVAGTDEFGTVDETPAHRSFVIRPDAKVRVADLRFVPRMASAPQGGVVEWTFVGPSDHTVTDASGMMLYNSGVGVPGTTFDVQFIGAGIYAYACSLHPVMEGTAAVPVVVSPQAGGIDTEFTVTWAAADAPSGFAFDVQLKRPASTRWEPWMTGQTVPSGTFVPDMGAGVYSFRSRFRDTATGATSGYSPSISVMVT